MRPRRADTVLAERGLARSRASAAQAIRAGRVRLGRDGRVLVKPSELIDPEAELELIRPERYVSRGGYKLEHALDSFGVDPAGRDCLDVGASTGGFTDCLLQRGAARVIALDVGRGQLDWRLRNDRRVHVLEGVNARELTAEQLPFRPQLATIDVSFISLTKVLPAVAGVLREDGEVLAMVKPQFELGPERVGKGGVVRDPDARREAVLAVARCAAEVGLAVRGFTPSGLPGPKGNRETFVWAARRGPGAGDLEAALAGVDV